MRPATLTTLALLLILAATRAAEATQHLVRAGESWQGLADRLKPGDEIILMPGNHRPGRLVDVHGTGKQPIVIRGLAPEKPAMIEAKQEGLVLRGSRNIVIRDLAISGASINGLTLMAPEGWDGSEPWPANLRLENLTVTRIGPSGRRHGIQIDGLQRVQVIGCTLEGWGGAGIEVSRSADVEINACSFRGLPGFSQDSAIHVRGGTDLVQVKDCRITDPGRFGLIIGGEADALLSILDAVGDKTADPKGTDTAVEPAHTVSRVLVMRSVIVGSGCPIHFLSASYCRIRNVTIVRPRQWVMAIDMGDPNEPLASSEHLTFGGNLIVWEPGDLRRLVHPGAHHRPPAMKFEENLWWSSESPEQRAALGDLPEPPSVPQRTDLDPVLDETLQPTVPDAQRFGATAP
jgi:hypothetical protein